MPDDTLSALAYILFAGIVTALSGFSKILIPVFVSIIAGVLASSTVTSQPGLEFPLESVIPSVNMCSPSSAPPYPDVKI